MNPPVGGVYQYDYPHVCRAQRVVAVAVAAPVYSLTLKMTPREVCRSGNPPFGAVSSGRNQAHLTSLRYWN